MARDAKFILDSPNCKCDCGCTVFHEAMVIKRVSALMSPTGKEELYPIPVLVCDKCGKVLKEFAESANGPKILGLYKDYEAAPDNAQAKTKKALVS